MTLVVPDCGEAKLLDDLLGTASPGSQTLKLYTNNFDCVEGTVAGGFTEASGSGYAAKALARATWGAAATAAGTTSKAYPAQAFAFSGAITIVGYYVVDTASGTLLWAERLFAGAGQAFANGDSLTVTPRLELS